MGASSANRPWPRLERVVSPAQTPVRCRVKPTKEGLNKYPLHFPDAQGESALPAFLTTSVTYCHRNWWHMPVPREPLLNQRFPNSKAVACLRNDLDDLLTCLRYPKLAERKQARTTNAIERRFREVRGRPRPMGTFLGVNLLWTASSITTPLWGSMRQGTREFNNEQSRKVLIFRDFWDGSELSERGGWWSQGLPKLERNTLMQAPYSLWTIRPYPHPCPQHGRVGAWARLLARVSK